jgi:hypothetical protein
MALVTVLTMLLGGSGTSQKLETPSLRLSFDGGSVSFPTDWRRIQGTSKDPAVLRAPDGQIQATVSVIYESPAADPIDQRELFKKVVEARMRAERQVAGSRVVLSEAAFKQPADGSLYATYNGREGVTRRFSAAVVMQRGIVVVVYVEAIGNRQTDLPTVADKIFATISVGG